MRKSFKINIVVLFIGCFVATAANAISFNHFSPPFVGCITLTVKPTGAITCNTVGTSTTPFNFSDPALSCPQGIAISSTTGLVSCAKTLPLCTLSATPTQVAPGKEVTLTASCSPAATGYQWTSSAGLPAVSDNAATVTVTVPETTAPGVYAYSVAASNAGGTGNTASTQVMVGSTNQKRQFAYVAHQISSVPAPGTLSLLDISTASLATTSIPLSVKSAEGSYPVGVAVNAIGTRVYVSNNGGNTVSVIDAVTNTLIKTIPVGSGTVDARPFSLAVSPRGTQVYVANSGSKNVSVIDTGSNTVIATPSVGNTPTGVAINQAGTHVYVTNQADDTISLIDTSTLKATESVQLPVGSKPYGVSVSGARVFVTNSGTSSVTVIDTGVKPYVIRSVNVGLKPLGIDVSPDGKTLYVVNNGDRTVSVIDVATTAVIDTVTVGMLPVDVSFTPKGALAYVTNQGENTVSVIDVTAHSTIPGFIPLQGGGLWAFGKFIASANAIDSGLWNNPNENGWGMSVIQHGNMLFNAIYTYDQAGMPTWYVMSSCPLTGSSCTGDIYKVTGGTPPTQPWVSGSVKPPISVGVGTLTFADAKNAIFYFEIDKVPGTKKISLFDFGSKTTSLSENYTDMWWNQEESGWGVALTQQNSMIFAAWYEYDSSGNAIWYVASSCPVEGNACMGDLYQVTGGSPLTSVWNDANKVTTKVGTLTLSFIDAKNGSMNYSINGKPGSKNITRQLF